MAVNNHFAKFKRGSVEMIYGNAVRSFDFEAAAKNTTMNDMKFAVRDLRALVDAAKAKAEELAASKDFTPAGKKSQLAAWAQTEVAKAMKKAERAARGAESGREGVRELMRSKLFDADKTDFAAAMVRSDIRRWLAAMDAPKRNAFLRSPDVSPEIALAVHEAPAALSGISEEQRAEFHDRSLLAAHPALAEQIDEIDEAEASLSDHVRAVRKTLEAGGLTGPEIDAALGVPSLKDKIAASLDAEGGAEAA